MKKLLLTYLISLIAGSVFEQVGSFAGAFARMGFGARGLSMGNAMVSNIFTDNFGYYNPAISTFQEQGIVNVGYSFMSFDRSLNFVGFSRKFKLPNQEKGGAGITLSWINSGVSDIDGRNNDTRQIGMFSTFDNQFYLGTGFLLDEQLAIGVGFKLYYSKLFEDVTSKLALGFDVGAIYKLRHNLTIGLAVRDLGAKNEWSSSEIYGSSGNITVDKFPTLINIGSSYKLPDNKGSVTLEAEYIKIRQPENFNSDSGVELYDEFSVKLGGEYKLTESIILRAGIERINFGVDDFFGNIKPAAGFGFTRKFSEDINLGLDYSFQLEPYSKSALQNVSLVFKFK